MNLDQDWKSAMVRAGCNFTDYVKKVQREIISDNKDDIYDAVVMYLEKEYPTGTLRCKVVVDIAMLINRKQPEIGLCEELVSHVNTMDMKAREDE